jgi:DNA-binding IclR family transcriptional regulator
MDSYETPSEHVRRILVTAPGPLTTRHVAETVGVTPPSAARILRRLEDQGAAVRRNADGGCYAWTVSMAAATETRPVPPARPSDRQ